MVRALILDKLLYSLCLSYFINKMGIIIPT